MTESLVVDASFTVRLVVANPEQARCTSLMGQWTRHGYDLCAPALWVYETTSAICKLVGLGDLTGDQGRRALRQAQRLALRLVPPDDAQLLSAVEWTTRLNRAAAYDSFYLALAQTLGCDLWTADRQLCNAVDKPWVHCVGKG